MYQRAIVEGEPEFLIVQSGNQLQRLFACGLHSPCPLDGSCAFRRADLFKELLDHLFSEATVIVDDCRGVGGEGFNTGLTLSTLLAGLDGGQHIL